MWSLAGSQAVDQPICCFGSGSRLVGWSTALGLNHRASQSAALGLCGGQLASAPGVDPPKVSGVGALLGFQLWAPSLLIWVQATGFQVSAAAAYPAFTVQGLRGEGRQRPRLLWRVL